MWFISSRKTRRTPITRSPRGKFRPHLEALEDRTVPSAGWADALGTIGGTYAHGVAVDTTNAAVYVAGNQIAKYTTDGHVAWSQSLGGSSYLANVDWGVAVDSTGAVYASGYFTGSMTLGTQTLTSAGGDDAFVAKLDSAGNVLWAESFGGAGDDRAYGIAVDNSGAYIAGRYSGTVSFGANPLTSAGDTDVFALKLDPSGNVVYATSAGGTGHDSGSNIAIDGSGQAYVTGYFAGSANFGSVNLTSIGSQDGFISQVDVNGHFTWARQVGSATKADQVLGVAADAAGHVFATGNFYGTTAFGDTVDDGSGATNLTVQGTTDAFVTSLDAATGHFLWTEQIGGAGATTHGYGVALDGAGNVYTAGTFGGSTGTGIDCDPGPGNAILTIQSSNFLQDGFVSELSPAGGFIGAWQQGAGSGNSSATSTGIAVGSDGSVYTAGTFIDSARFDTGTQYVSLTDTGGDGFVSRMTPGQSVIMGQVFNDKNNNGIKDSGDTPFAGVTVYLDLNNNGVRDSGEPYTTTNAQGGFSFNHLAPGTYTVREVVPSGYTITTATSFTVNLAAGQFDDNSSFGDHKTPKTTVYSNNRSVSTTRRQPNAISTLAISDNYPIQDLSITLKVTNNALQPLTIILYAPDGTPVTLLSNTATNGTLTYHVPAFIGKNVSGTWTLEVDGLAGGTLNNWSLSVLG